MTFLDIRFPSLISRNAVGGPVFTTHIGTVDSGYEYRNQSQTIGLARYDVSHAVRKKELFDTLRAFFLVVHGRRDGFRFKDWTDYSATASEGIFSQLTATTFQMYKRYTFGASTYDRKITKPVSGTSTITGGTSPSVATATGIVTVASGTPTAWASEYDVPCRFDIDEIRAEIVGGNDSRLIMGWQGIQIKETREIA